MFAVFCAGRLYGSSFHFFICVSKCRDLFLFCEDLSAYGTLGSSCESGVCTRRFDCRDDFFCVTGLPDDCAFYQIAASCALLICMFAVFCAGRLYCGSFYLLIVMPEGFTAFKSICSNLTALAAAHVVDRRMYAVGSGLKILLLSCFLIEGMACLLDDFACSFFSAPCALLICCFAVFRAGRFNCRALNILIVMTESIAIFKGFCALCSAQTAALVVNRRVYAVSRCAEIFFRGIFCHRLFMCTFFKYSVHAHIISLCCRK